MSFDWKNLPEFSNAVFIDAASRPVDYPVHLGALNEELQAACQGKPIAVPLLDRNWIRCQGAEAQSFLHNQLTSDINHLAVSTWQHSSWCTAKGRMLASFIAARPNSANGVASDAFYLQLATELRPAIAKRLKMYVLRAKAQIELTEDMFSIGLAANANNAKPMLAELGIPFPETTGSCENFPEGWIMQVHPGMLQITTSTKRAVEVFSSLTKSARPTGLSAWHWLEIQAGLPMVRQETQEEFVPQMVNFDKIGGVSFHKGCYPGQEIVARTQYLGKVKRHLYRVHADTPLVPGMSLNVNDTEGQHAAGIIANAAACPNGGFDALAVILESAIANPIHADRPDGPTLSSISLVAA